MMMHRNVAAIAALAALAFAGTTVVTAQAKTQAKTKVAPAPQPVDYAAIAEKVVGTSANVKEGDIVEVHGGVDDLALLEEIVIAVRKRGAYPLLTITTDKIARAMNTAVPEKYDAQAPKLALALTKTINVRIVIPPVRDPSVFALLAPERHAARDAAEQPVVELALKRKVRVVELSNGLAPSPSRAKELGVTEAELAKIFWDGLNADYSAVETKCKALQASIAAGTELRITHTNGTDLKMKVKGRKSFVSDGVTSDAEVKAGGPGVQVWLPAGDVYLTPVPGTAVGKLVDERLVFMGKEITGVVIDIAKGKTTAVNAKSGWDAVEARYGAAGPGKTEVGLVDFGCNPAIKSGGKLETWMGAGMVTVGIGGNLWAGGANKEPFALSLQLSGATVTVDGNVVIEAGELK